MLVFHVANGGLRTKREAAKLKWTGVLAGVPDLVVIAPSTGRCAHIYFIEVKAEKGVLSIDQEIVINKLRMLGAPVAIVRSIDDVRAAFKVWRIRTRESRTCRQT